MTEVVGVTRAGWFWLALSALVLSVSACGPENETDAGTRVVFAVGDLDLLGSVEVDALGKSWVFTEVTAGDCDSKAIEVDAEKITVQALSKYGFEWSFVRSLRRGECNVIPISLENPTTAIFAVMVLRTWDEDLEVYVDGESRGEVVHALTEDDLERLERLEEVKDLRGQRRRLLELGREGKAVVLTEEPGTYEIELWSWSGEVLESKSMELTSGYVDYRVVDTFDD